MNLCMTTRVQCSFGLGLRSALKKKEFIARQEFVHWRLKTSMVNMESYSRATEHRETCQGMRTMLFDRGSRGTVTGHVIKKLSTIPSSNQHTMLPARSD